MRVIPAIDIRGGKCVQLVGGKPGTEQVEIDDVLGVAMRWQNDGAEIIHVIDLDSALGTGDNLRLVEKLAGSLSIPVQVGGGIRTKEQVEKLFAIGCERVIVGTRAIEDRPFIVSLSNEYPDGIVVAVDSLANKILVEGWQTDSGKELLTVVGDLQALPIFGFLYTNVEVEGRLHGIDPLPIQAILNATKKPIIVSGGVTTMRDLQMLREMGAHSVIIGMAIYTGSIDFKKAVREFR